MYVVNDSFRSYRRCKGLDDYPLHRLSLLAGCVNILLWIRIFHVRPHSMTRLIFIGEKLVLEKLESPFILFYFKRENKIRKKTLKK